MIALTLAAFAGLAMGSLGGPAPSGLVVLNPTANAALSMTGNAKILVPSKVAYVNSNSAQAIKTTGTAVLDVAQMYIVGEASFGGQSYCTGTVTQSVTAFLDPFSGLDFPLPEEVANMGDPTLSGEVTLNPGYYPQGLEVTGNTQVHFNSGVYVLGGAGLKLTSGSLSGEEVCLIIHEGSLSIAGSTSTKLTPPLAGAEMAGVVIAQPQANGNGMDLAGGAQVMISGAIYAPGALLTLVGTSDVEGEGPQMGDLVVSDKLALKGTACIKIGGPAAVAIDLPKEALYD
jgi:hypothetical protein